MLLRVHGFGKGFRIRRPHNTRILVSFADGPLRALKATARSIVTPSAEHVITASSVDIMSQRVETLYISASGRACCRVQETSFVSAAPAPAPAITRREWPRPRRRLSHTEAQDRHRLRLEITTFLAHEEPEAEVGDATAAFAVRGDSRVEGGSVPQPRQLVVQEPGARRRVAKPLGEHNAPSPHTLQTGVQSDVTRVTVGICTWLRAAAVQARHERYSKPQFSGALGPGTRFGAFTRTR
ncbi:hypothetical protein EVAR_11130_1 [Eumeta japonica]|uniref:Uncharacterized protein n=1 Tax=Eumeta variegata TaxID=151549 RepID=A0A4C1U483_EUMVA|nr:hypothetical protein EVAR_11130_1 [Eumeta japonica]